MTTQSTPAPPNEKGITGTFKRIGRYANKNPQILWTALWIVVLPFAIALFYPRSAENKTDYLQKKIDAYPAGEKLEYLKKMGTGQVIEVPENIGLSYYTIVPNEVKQSSVSSEDDFYESVTTPFKSKDNSIIITDSTIYYFDQRTNKWKPYTQTLKNTEAQTLIGATENEIYFLSKTNDKYVISEFNKAGKVVDHPSNKNVFDINDDYGTFISPAFNRPDQNYNPDIYFYNDIFDSLSYYPVDDLTYKRSISLYSDDLGFSAREIDGRLFFIRRLALGATMNINDFQYMDADLATLKPVFEGPDIPKEFKANFMRGDIRFYGTGNEIQILLRDNKLGKFTALSRGYVNNKTVTNEIELPKDVFEKITNADSYGFLTPNLFKITFNNDVNTDFMLFQKTKNGTELLYDSQKDDPHYRYEISSFSNRDNLWFLLKSATGKYGLREIKAGESHFYELPNGYSDFYLAPTPAGINVIGMIGNGIGYSVLSAPNPSTGKFEETLLDEHIYWPFNPFSAEYHYNPVSVVLLTGLAILLFMLGYIPLDDYSKREQHDVELPCYNYLPSLKEKFYDIKKSVLRLQRNSRLMLVAGVGLASMGIVVFVIMLTQQLDKITVLSDHFTWVNGVQIARTSVLFGFIETISFFFLRQYRVLFNEYKDFYALYLNVQRVFHLVDMVKPGADGELKFTAEQTAVINKIVSVEKFSFREVHTDNSVVDPDFIQVLSELRSTMDGIKEKIK